MKKMLLVTSALSLLASTAYGNILAPGSSLILYGDAYADFGEKTIEFISNSPTLPPNEFGSFVNLGVEVTNGNFLDLNWRNLGEDIPFAGLGSGSNLVCGSTCLLSWGNGNTGGGGWLNIDTLTVGPVNLPDTQFVFVYGTGTVSCAGTFVCDPTPAVWSMSASWVDSPLAPSGWWQSLGIMTVPVAVPGPIVGAGLPGMIAAALAVMLGLGRRRRLGAN
jgi:hypothetical protein